MAYSARLIGPLPEQLLLQIHENRAFFIGNPPKTRLKSKQLRIPSNNAL